MFQVSLSSSFVGLEIVLLDFVEKRVACRSFMGLISRWHLDH